MKSISAQNIPLFIAFRTLFNARWYYPVIGVLFVDLGLSLAQYALLNVAWAVAIVCLEVPSGAIADQIGRRRVLILAGLFMVAEMLLLAFAPRGSEWLFSLLLLNRIFSGAAEAAASGADESLAYDSLVDDGRKERWPDVLSTMMRWQAVGFFVAMMLGAAVYDPALVQTCIDALHLPFHVTAGITLRWPLYLTLGNAILVLLITLRMREPAAGRLQYTVSLPTVVRQTFSAGWWILHTPLALFVILAGLSIDSIVRLYLTLESNYLRLIDLPEASYGVIGSAFALIGFFTPPLAKAMVARRSVAGNFTACALVAMSGLVLGALIWPKWGALAFVPLGIGMSLLQFFLSHYLNEAVTDSSKRATVLSFKGLSFNLAYGTLGLVFSGFTMLRSGAGTPDQIFTQALRWMPAYFVVVMALLVVAALRLLRVR